MQAIVAAKETHRLHSRTVTAQHSTCRREPPHTPLHTGAALQRLATSSGKAEPRRRAATSAAAASIDSLIPRCFALEVAPHSAAFRRAPPHTHRRMPTHTSAICRATPHTPQTAALYRIPPHTHCRTPSHTSANRLTPPRSTALHRIPPRPAPAAPRCHAPAGGPTVDSGPPTWPAGPGDPVPARPGDASGTPCGARRAAPPAPVSHRPAESPSSAVPLRPVADPASPICTSPGAES